MNRQKFNLMTATLLLILLANVGCDLGTYNARFKERSNPRTTTPAETDTNAPSDE